MSSTPAQGDIWAAFSNQTAELAEQAGRAVVAVEAGDRVAASGVHWREGVIVTAAHLVRRADEATVTLPGGSTAKGTLIGRDATTDLAVVSISDHSTLRTLPFASSARVGEFVLAIARSGRGELSASAGIIARTGENWRTWRGGEVDRLLRPDVRLYPGQSGSVLINGHGEVLGVNSAILARDSVITLPVETVDRVANELLEHGHIAQPYLGIAVQQVPLPPEWQKAAGTTQEQGLLVMHVHPEGPSKRAGVALGDVIVSIDAQRMDDLRALRRQLAKKRIQFLRGLNRKVVFNPAAHKGELVAVKLLRAGNVIETSVELADRPTR